MSGTGTSHTPAVAKQVWEGLAEIVRGGVEVAEQQKVFLSRCQSARSSADQGLTPWSEYRDGSAAEKDIALLDSTWDEGVSVGVAAKKVQVVILGTGEAWMQHAIAAMGHSFRGRAAGACMPCSDSLTRQTSAMQGAGTTPAEQGSLEPACMGG